MRCPEERVGLLLLALVGLCCAHGVAPAGEGAPDVGDMVKVTVGPAPLMDKKRPIALLEKGDVLKVLGVEGDWLKVIVNTPGKYALGWIHNTHIKLEARGSRVRGKLTLEPTLPEDRPDGKEASEIVARSQAAREKHPLPASLKGYTLPFGRRLTVEAATVEVVGAEPELALRVFVVTKETDVPRNARCLILGFSDDADLKKTSSLLRSFARAPGGYAGIETQEFGVMILDEGEKAKERVLVFGGPLTTSKVKEAEPFFYRLGHLNNVGVQLCTPAPGFPKGCKPASDLSWVRATRTAPPPEAKADGAAETKPAPPRTDGQPANPPSRGAPSPH